MKPDSALRRRIAAMPKVELHRHLEGSIRLQTLVEVARQYQIPLPGYDVETLRPYVQVTANDPHNLDSFLSKFGVLRKFYRSPDVVRRITAEVVEDAAADNVRYMELRFTPFALASQMHFPLRDVMQWVCQSAREAADRCGIVVRLIVSVNRHERVEYGFQALQAACDFRDMGVVGVDLAGRETGFPARPFCPMFIEAKQDGLGITVHAGEWQGPENVRDAIENMGADRIGHGVRVVEDSGVVRLAVERGVVFEVCPTSNLQSGVVRDVRHHPLRDLYYLKLPVTINTDDPTISNIALSDELMLAVEALGFSPSDLRKYTLAAARAAFLPPEEKAALLEALRSEFDRQEQDSQQDSTGVLASVKCE